ncbi:Uncharacterised protein [uncultured archaeon]|nr:Uncharacterised protein [uncultured archaeon]
MFGEKGQSFDVFKLLISAVVAIAILVLLMNVLNIVPGIGSEEPEKIAEDLIKSKSTQIGSPGYNNVTFKNGHSLSAKTLSLKSDGLSDAQICVLISDSTPNRESFTELSPGKVVQYNGQSPQKARLVVLCDREKDIVDTLTTYGLSSSAFGVSTSACNLNLSNTQKYCIVSTIAES